MCRVHKGVARKLIMSGTHDFTLWLVMAFTFTRL